MSNFCGSSRFNTENYIRLMLLKQEIEEVDSEDGDATITNNDTDDDEFFLIRRNEKKYED